MNIDRVLEVDAVYPVAPVPAQQNHRAHLIIPDGTTCSICLEDVTQEHSIAGQVHQTACHHFFHAECLNGWSNSGSPNAHTCPNCRTQLAPPAFNFNGEMPFYRRVGPAFWQGPLTTPTVGAFATAIVFGYAFDRIERQTERDNRAWNSGETQATTVAYCVLLALYCSWKAYTTVS